MDDVAVPESLLHGRRLAFADAPAGIRRWVTDRIGVIEHHRDCLGGMSTGIAVVLDNANSYFVKAIDGAENPRGRSAYVREAEIAALLPHHPSLPRLLHAGAPDDAPHWWINLFAAAPGRHVDHPWTPATLRRVLTAWDDVTPALWSTPWTAPANLDLLRTPWHQIGADPADPWHPRARDRLADEAWLGDRLHGTPTDAAVLAHVDLRADNIVADDAGRVSFVDWAHPGLAARWMDVALLLADVVASGADDAATLVLDTWRRHPVCGDYDPRHLMATIAGLGAALHRRALGPADPTLPHRAVWAAAASTAIGEFLDRTSTGNPN